MISVSHTQLGVEGEERELVGSGGLRSGRGLDGDVFRFVGGPKDPRIWAGTLRGARCLAMSPLP